MPSAFLGTHSLSSPCAQQHVTRRHLAHDAQHPTDDGTLRTTPRHLAHDGTATSHDTVIQGRTLPGTSVLRALAATPPAGRPADDLQGATVWSWARPARTASTNRTTAATVWAVRTDGRTSKACWAPGISA